MTRPLKGKVKDELTAPMFDVVFIQALIMEPIDAKSIQPEKHLKSEVAEVKAAGLNPWLSPGRRRSPEDALKKLADSIIPAAMNFVDAALP